MSRQVATDVVTLFAERLARRLESRARATLNEGTRNALDILAEELEAMVALERDGADD